MSIYNRAQSMTLMFWVKLINLKSNVLTGIEACLNNRLILAHMVQEERNFIRPMRPVSTVEYFKTIQLNCQLQ